MRWINVQGLGYSELPAHSRKGLNSKALFRAEPGAHPRGSGDARGVPPLSRVWPLFPIRLGAQGFAPPQPLFLPRQFCALPSADHAPARPSLWTHFYLRGEGCKLAKHARGRGRGQCGVFSRPHGLLGPDLAGQSACEPSLPKPGEQTLGYQRYRSK